MRFAKFANMPDEQREPKQDDKRQTTPESKIEIRPERRARRTYVTEDRENPLICRGID